LAAWQQIINKSEKRWSKNGSLTDRAAVKRDKGCHWLIDSIGSYRLEDLGNRPEILAENPQ
jgi:hypothetical protein